MGARSGPRGNGFGGNRNPNEYGGWDRRQGGPMQDKIETTFTVPSSKCGIIIGKGKIILINKYKDNLKVYNKYTLTIYFNYFRR